MSDPGFDLPIIVLAAGQSRRMGRDKLLLEINGVPLATSTIGDHIFRRLRHLVGGLETSIMVLITAEIIAKVYYAAIRQTTQSVVLRTLCDQILSDEEKHVSFQSEQLMKLQEHRGIVSYWMARVVQRALFLGALQVVSLLHRRALIAGGVSCFHFQSSSNFTLGFHTLLHQ